MGNRGTQQISETANVAKLEVRILEYKVMRKQHQKLEESNYVIKEIHNTLVVQSGHQH